MGNIPVQMRDDEVKEWIESFAPIKAYNLVKDPSRVGYSKGYCFFEFGNEDDHHIDSMIECIMSKDLQGRKLKVQRASIGKRNEQLVNNTDKNNTNNGNSSNQVTVQDGKKSNSNELLNYILTSNFTYNN